MFWIFSFCVYNLRGFGSIYCLVFSTIVNIAGCLCAICLNAMRCKRSAERQGALITLSNFVTKQHHHHHQHHHQHQHQHQHQTRTRSPDHFLKLCNKTTSTSTSDTDKEPWSPGPYMKDRGHHGRGTKHFFGGQKSLWTKKGQNLHDFDWGTKIYVILVKGPSWILRKGPDHSLPLQLCSKTPFQLFNIDIDIHEQQRS